MSSHTRAHTHLLDPVVQEIRRSQKAREACPGHRFLDVRDQTRPITGWRCLVCHETFNVGEVAIYRQGLRHAARGHRDEFVIVVPGSGPGEEVRGE